jgi:lipopolysaccharide/colanic/teichoic acid biosynthesis glycosyltransferase
MSSSRTVAGANVRAVPRINRDGAIRRLTNAFLAGALLLLLSPLMLAIAVGICIETGRPVFFMQTRLGRGARPFRLVKFRKFRQDCGAAQLPLTLYNDSRLTRIGRLLERSKFDELPQLWNVVKGEMAIVGPRPESLTFRDCFAGAYHAVLEHTPGIFGPSQALFRNEGKLYRPDWEPEAFYRAILFPAKARLDLTYYPIRTPIRDLIWVFHGVLAVLGCAPISRHVAMMARETTDAIRSLGDLSTGRGLGNADCTTEAAKNAGNGED